MSFPYLVSFFAIFLLLSKIFMVFAFPYLVAYFYRRLNYVPWSVWEKKPKTKIYNSFVACQSDFKRNIKIL